jgi:hypothetical protein
MKMVAFWYAAPCSLVQKFTDVSEILAHRPDYGEGKNFRNVEKFLQATWCNNPENNYLQLKSVHIFTM